MSRMALVVDGKAQNGSAGKVTMALGKLELHISQHEDSEPDEEGDLVAYVSLPAHPGRRVAGGRQEADSTSRPGW